MSKRGRAALGVFLTCLLGWAAEFLIVLMSFWASYRINLVQVNDWWMVPWALMWLGFFPACGFVMGVTHAYLCPASVFGEDEQRHQNRICKWIFWLAHIRMSRFLILSACGCLAPVVIPVLNISYNQGQKIGNRWVETCALETLLGRRNEWERDENSEVER